MIALIGRAITLVFLVLGLSSTGHTAVNCAAFVAGGELDFGNIDIFNGPNDQAMAVVYYCTRQDGDDNYVSLCFNLNKTAASERVMQGQANGDALDYEVYLDGARTIIWGSNSDNSNNNLVRRDRTFGNNNYFFGLFGAYGRIFANQTASRPDTYVEAMAGADTELTFRTHRNRFPNRCESNNNTGNFPFDVVATVEPQCNPNFAVEDLNFGNGGLLTAAINATNLIRPQCTNTTPYQIALDNGQYANGNERRMQNANGDFVSYELYRDAGRTQRWGDTENVDTLSMTGDGTVQQAIVYGQVPPQATPSSGTYSDTVTVTLIF